MNGISKNLLLVTIATAALYGLSCQSHKPLNKNYPTKRNLSSISNLSADDLRFTPLIRFDFVKGEITQLCEQIIKNYEADLAKIIAIKKAERTFENTFLTFERVSSNFSVKFNEISFVTAVSTSSELRQEASECKNKVGQFGADLYSRKTLYEALAGLEPTGKIEKKMYEETLLDFKYSGMHLTETEKEVLRKLNEKHSELTNKFSLNLTNSLKTIEFTEDELEGLSQSHLQNLNRTSDGLYRVTSRITDYLVLAENAKNSETRRKNYVNYTNRAADENTKLFLEILKIRRQIVAILGYDTWADLKLELKMAKKVSTVHSFLEDLSKKLKPAQRLGQKRFLAFKKQRLDSNAIKVDPWDTAYIANQIKKSEYEIDNEVVQEYFPADHVINGMFKVFSQLFKIEIEKIENAPTWHPTVDLYSIRNTGEKDPIAYFYADLESRLGKRSGAAAFSLIPGHGTPPNYIKPVSAIVADFTPATDTKPSLLRHNEVETLFHEFGHVLHQTLTKVNYASVSGTSVYWDFVEAPSQLLEHWVWDEKVLKEISGHYKDTTKKIPDELLEKMIKLRDFNQADLYMRQLLLAQFDMKVHTSKSEIDINKSYRELAKSLMNLDIPDYVQFASGFNHIVSGGYQAGYYGYLWSEVFADDLHSLFQSSKFKLMDSKLGQKYRSLILEVGGTEEPLQMMKSFLGREPSNKAFMKKFNL